MIGRAVLLGAAGTLTLSGCVAAVASVLAGAAIGERGLRQPRTERPEWQVAVAAPAPRAVLPAPPTAPASRVAPAFAPGSVQLTELRALPPPSAAKAPSRPEPGTGPDIPSAAGWRGLIRYVAERLTTKTAGGVLPGAGGSAPCGDRPPAVMIDADVLEGPAGDRAEAASALGVLRTMGVATLAAADDPVVARTALRTAGLSDTANIPVVARGAAGDTADRYCVVALAGRRPGDFPEERPLLPRWDAGWFLLAHAPSRETPSIDEGRAK